MSAPSTENERPSWPHLILIAAVCVAAYANALDAPFIYDDLSNITQNPYMRVEGFDLPGYVRAAFDSPSPRPLANLSFALNHAACGFEVTCYRAVNICIHLTNGLLVYALGIALFLRLRPGDERGARNLSLLAALVFVAHPIQIQSVTYVVQRMTSMATLFYLSALLCWLQPRARLRGPRRWGWWAAAACFGGLAFSSKQIAVSLPFAIVLVEWIFFQDARWNWLRGRMLPIAGLLAVVAAAGVGILALHGFPGYEDRDFTLGQRLLTQLRVVPFYIGLLALPLPGRLNLIHDFEASVSLWQPLSTGLGGLFLLALLAVGIAVARRQRLLSFAILWFFLTMLLESTVLPLELAYEHRLYLPTVAISLCVADGLARLVRRREALMAALGGALVVALGVGSHVRNEVWTDAPTLWYDVAAKSPLERRAHDNLLRALGSVGRLPEAKRHLDAVIEERPDYAAAWHARGMVEELLGDSEQARVNFAEAIHLDPDEPFYQMKLGLILARLDDLDAAIETLETVTGEHPDFKRGFFALGIVLQRGSRVEAAQAAYREAVRIDPDYRKAHMRLATNLADQRDFAQAAHHIREAVRLDPYNDKLRELLRQAEAATRGIRAP